MKVIGCRDIGLDCSFETAGDHDDEVLHDLAHHCIDVHKDWPEDGPTQSWVRIRALIREVAGAEPKAQ